MFKQSRSYDQYGHHAHIGPYGKKLQNFLLQNQWPDGREIWYIASGTRGLLYQDYLNDDPGLTLTYFTARSIWENANA